MGNSVKPTQSDIDIARMGINLQFTAMFDEPTRKTLETLDIQKFIEHMVQVRASDQAYLRFYANCLHPKAKDS